MIEIPVKCLDLDQTLDCGQCFRWNKSEDGSYIGVIKDRVVKLKLENNILKAYSNKEENLESVISSYLDLGTDYEKIEEEICKIDENVKKATLSTSGIRFLKQDKFEIIISFIISANNMIPRIKKSIDEISRRWGEKVIFQNNEYYLFPKVQELSKVSIEEFRETGVGFRDKYIFDTVQKINENSEILYLNGDDKTLKERLIAYKGIGPKVADCIMLFGYGNRNTFPVDTWIKKIMQRLYYENIEVNNEKIHKESLEKYGEYASIVQQHIFQAVRKGLI